MLPRPSSAMEDYSDLSKRRRMEYATQFLGFPPDSLVDTLIGDATDVVAANLKAAKQQISASYGAKVSQAELAEAFDAIQGRYVEAVEKIYYKFGSYLKENILNVPEDVLLPTDAGAHADPKKECGAAELKVGEIME